MGKLVHPQRLCGATISNKSCASPFSKLAREPRKRSTSTGSSIAVHVQALVSNPASRNIPVRHAMERGRGRSWSNQASRCLLHVIFAREKVRLRPPVALVEPATAPAKSKSARLSRSGYLQVSFSYSRMQVYVEVLV